MTGPLNNWLMWVPVDLETFMNHHVFEKIEVWLQLNPEVANVYCHGNRFSGNMVQSTAVNLEFPNSENFRNVRLIIQKENSRWSSLLRAWSQFSSLLIIQKPPMTYNSGRFSRVTHDVLVPWNLGDLQYFAISAGNCLGNTSVVMVRYRFRIPSSERFSSDAQWGILSWKRSKILPLISFPNKNFWRLPRCLDQGKNFINLGIPIINSGIFPWGEIKVYCPALVDSHVMILTWEPIREQVFASY